MKHIKYIFPVLFLTLTGCGDNTIDDSKIKVSTTFAPVFDFANRIFKDKAEIITIVSSNEPHGFRPNDPRVSAFTEKADLVFAYGLEMDSYAKNMCDASKYHEITKDVEFDMVGGRKDPHAWLSFDQAIKMLNTVKETAIDLDPDNAAFYTQNYQEASQSFLSVKEEYIEKIKAKESKTLVTSHEAFHYFAKEFGLEEYGIGDINGNEPSASRIQQIIAYIQENQIKTIFLESLDSEKYVRTIRDELERKGYELQYEVLSAYESVSKEEYFKGEDYLSVMRANLSRIEKSL